MVKFILNKAEVQAKTGLTIFYSFLAVYVASVVVTYLANLLFPNDVVLGTYSLTPWWALHLSMTKLAVITTFAIPFVYYHEWKRGKNYEPKEWMLVYFIVNTLAVWGIARFAEQLGFGISHWWVAVLLGAALDWTQGFAMMTLAKLLKQE